MSSNRRILGVMVVTAFLCACDRSPAPPSSSAGQGISNLSSTPNSILGKSAQTGKNAVAGIQARQDEAANAANQISGQSASEEVVGGLKFAIPEGWKRGNPSSSMTKATYTIAAAGNAQCNFSTAGGDVASNLARWKGQMTDENGNPVEGEVRDERAMGLRVTIYKATGTYAAMGGSKQSNTAFRGAIIQGPASTVFIRLTGPAEQIGAADGAWEQMVLGFNQ